MGHLTLAESYTEAEQPGGSTYCHTEATRMDYPLEGQKRLEIRGDETREEKRRGNNSPVAVSDKSCVLKPSWTCSILSVV